MKGQPVRRTVAPILVLLVIGAGLAPPLLDAADESGATRVESRHDPSTCGRLHDHAACTQLVKSFSHLAWGWSPDHDRRLPVRGDRIARRMALPFRPFSSAPAPRAPPTPRS